MKKYTQSNTSPGNCWQTAVACILEVDPVNLPPQHELEAITYEQDRAIFEGWGSYTNILNGYLKKHHGLIYSEIHQYQFGSVKPTMGWHTMNGPTVRTAAFEAKGQKHVNHAVVGFEGKLVWDVHPSEAGLLAVNSWGVIGERMEGLDLEREKLLNERPGYKLVFDCLCPSCNLGVFRSKLAELVNITPSTQCDTIKPS